jgi:DNA repair exonuclease SbcCD ATPase subunit
MALFQSECSIELTETFDVNIKKRYGEYIAYDRFSGGEKIRIDLALMFSFVSFTKQKTGAITNLLFFDEILDSSLDTSGISSLVQILKLFTTNGFSIFVVSHRDSNRSEDFDSVLTITKERFSKINIEE